MMTVSLRVNGEERRLRVQPRETLLRLLRDRLALTGTKESCGEGECGACTVLVEGVPIRSCITTIGEVAGEQVETVEGLSQNGQLHKVQQAFVDKQAMQCGYCVPGHIMAAVAFIRDNPNASREDVVAEMSQHICRCCNYSNILAAVQQAVSVS